MEMAAIGFLAGALTCMIFMGVGIVVGRIDNTAHKDLDEGEPVLDSDSVSDVRSRDRSGSSNQSDDLRDDAQRAINAITVMKMSVRYSRAEKEALDYAENCILMRERLLDMIEKTKKGDSDEDRD